MAEGATPTRRWAGRGIFAALALALIFVRLLPLGTAPAAWAGPDLLLTATIAWTIRRPQHLPVLMIGAIFLVADLLFQRPPGLMAAAVVIGTEALRRRHGQLRRMPFLLEWASAGLVIVAIAFGQRLALAAVALPQAPMPLTMIELAATVLAYPLVTGIAWAALGVSRRAPGEVDALGHRL